MIPSLLASEGGVARRKRKRLSTVAAASQSVKSSQPSHLVSAVFGLFLFLLFKKQTNNTTKPPTSSRQNARRRADFVFSPSPSPSPSHAWPGEALHDVYALPSVPTSEEVIMVEIVVQHVQLSSLFEASLLLRQHLEVGGVESV